MATSFMAGNLKMSLPVKRVCDTQFQSLGDMIKTLGHVPFQLQRSGQRQNTATDPGCILPMMPHSVPVRDTDIGPKPFPVCNEPSLYQKQTAFLARPSAITRLLIDHGRTYDNLIASSHYIPLLAKVEPLSDLPGPSKSQRDSSKRGQQAETTAGPCTATVSLVRTEPLQNGGDGSVKATEYDDDPVYLRRRHAVDQDFTRWSCEALSAFPSYVHVRTFFELLRDVDSNAEVREYVQMYLGNTSDAKSFADEFIRKRAYWKWVTGRGGPLDVSEDQSPKEGVR